VLPPGDQQDGGEPGAEEDEGADAEGADEAGGEEGAGHAEQVVRLRVGRMDGAGQVGRIVGDDGAGDEGPREEQQRRRGEAAPGAKIRHGAGPQG
jgi:hypothetical protein